MTDQLDLISRQAALEVIGAVFPVDPMKSEYAQGIACGAALAKTYVEQLPPAQPEKCTDKRTETHACDCISRQAAIDEIDEWIKAFRENGHKESAADACLIQDGIIQIPSVQPEPHWIPCSERLPQPNEEEADGFIKAYLVQDGRWMDVARWNGDCWIAWGYGTALTNVIAWMPLPEPYKERRTDG